jgi:ribosomal protein S18 acetylase RimI-like enzyme
MEGIGVRAATSADEPFLYRMLFYAANMALDGAVSGEEARTNPTLAKYVCDWGRADDLGVIAEDAAGVPIGAAWLRVLRGAENNHPQLDERIPELAIAVEPAFIGQGVGTRLLAALLDAARGVFPAVALSVRVTNPARRLYERMGFTVIDTIVNRVGGDSWLMLYSFE